MKDMSEWWRSDRILDTLRLPPDEYFVLVSQLDAARQELRGPDQRGRARMRYWRRRTVILIHLPNGSCHAYDVKPHNISRTGIAFLHGFYVHPATACETALWTIDKEPVAIRGKVVRCRHLRGKTHEVGVHFESPIDLSKFLADYTPPEGEEDQKTDLPRFSGQVLYVDDSVDNRELLGYIAAELGIDLHSCAGCNEAMEAVARSRFDMVITRVQLPKCTATMLAKALREKAYAGIIVALGDSAAPELAAPGDEPGSGQIEGCDRVLTPPVTLERMTALFRDYLQCEQDAGTPLEPLVSSYWLRAGMQPLILKFVGRLEERVRGLQDLLACQQVAEFRRACHDFKGSAESYGFARIAQALSKLDTLSARQAEPERLKRQLAELSRLCAAAGLVRESEQH